MAADDVFDPFPLDIAVVLVLVLIPNVLIVSPIAIPRLILLITTLPLLLFLPGYALTVALFPTSRTNSGEMDNFGGNRRIDRLERFVLSITLSIFISIITGIFLGYTPIAISRLPVALIVTGVTALGLAIGTLRRLRDSTRRAPGVLEALKSLRSLNLQSRDRSWTMATLAVALAIGVTVGSIAYVAIAPPRGETYTEFSVLTETDEGEFVASGYPSDLTTEDMTTLYIKVENEELQPVTYTVVAQMIRTGNSGTANERVRLDSFQQRVDTGGEWTIKHTFRPIITGDRIRLTYLLYKSSSPPTPTEQNAYREVHIWVNVSSAPSSTSAS